VLYCSAASTSMGCTQSVNCDEKVHEGHPAADSVRSYPPLLGKAGGRARVSHIVLVVRDVGTSLDFYKNVLGFHQIDRPNFDRQGAWLSMGTLELHLIKGTPHVCRGQHPHDLIVSHIALELTDADAVVKRLRELQTKFEDLSWRQNLSVPTWETSFGTRFEKAHESSEGQLQQYFLEDPDGYWIELCNCGDEPDEETCTRPSIPLGSLAKLACRTLRWEKRARRRLSPKSIQKELAELAPIEPQLVTEQKLLNLRSRQATYGDVCQGFAPGELRDALAKAGDQVPGAILLLKSWRQTKAKDYIPPAFLDSSGKLHHWSA